MLRFLLRRLVLLPPTLVGITLLVFLAVHAAPGVRQPASPTKWALRPVHASGMAPGYGSQRTNDRAPIVVVAVRHPVGHGVNIGSVGSNRVSASAAASSSTSPSSASPLPPSTTVASALASGAVSSPPRPTSVISPGPAKPSGPSIRIVSLSPSEPRMVSDLMLAAGAE